MHTRGHFGGYFGVHPGHSHWELLRCVTEFMPQCVPNVYAELRRSCAEPRARISQHFALSYAMVVSRIQAMQSYPRVADDPVGNLGALLGRVRKHTLTLPFSYKRVKGRSHTVEKRISMHPHKPHATSQPSRFSDTHRLSTDSPHN